MPDPQSRLHSQASWPVQAVCYAALSAIFLYVIVARYFFPLAVSDSVEIVPPIVADVEQRIDPNVADWPELARLPGIGEAIAKRIVDYRRGQSPDGARAVFESPQDLEAVSGIGPKKIELMEPFLKFPSTAPGPASSR